MLTPQDVTNRVFDKAVFGGYDIAAVDTFLEQLTQDYTSLYRENAILKNKLRVLVDKVEEYRSTEDAMRMALLSAKKTARELEEEAQQKSEKLLAEAGDRRSFAVAGCCGGEGRSFVSVQLARALAQDGRRVMLVSAGRSGGCLPKRDGKPEFSLEDWLEGRCAPAELAHRSDAPGLWVIVRESLVRGGASRVRGEDIRALVGALEAEGFLVIVDSPAASRSVEAARIAGACSGTVLVVRYGRTRSGELAEAAAILRKPGGPAVGCVINGVRFTTLESRRKFRFWYSVSKRARRK